MPPRLPQRANFSLVGRYIIDVGARKMALATGEVPVFHDLANFSAECHIEDIPTGNQSRFENKNWALQRGFVQCEYCKVSP